MIAFVGLCAFFVGWCVGYVQGVNRGVVDTEERWSEAVGRKDAHDEQERVTAVELQIQLTRLYGVPFSERCYHALKSRAEKAEETVDESRVALARLNDYIGKRALQLVAMVPLGETARFEKRGRLDELDKLCDFKVSVTSWAGQEKR